MVLKMMPEEKKWDDLLIFLGIWSLYTWSPNTPKHILQALWGSTTEGRPGLCCRHPSPTASEPQPCSTWGTQEIIHRPAEPECLIFNIPKTKCKVMPSFYEVHGDCSEINEVLCLHYTRKLFNYTYLENASVIYLNIARLAFLVLRSRSRVCLDKPCSHWSCQHSPGTGLQADWSDPQVCLFHGTIWNTL